MPREVYDKLTATAVKQMKTPGRFADGCGLYLCVNENGAKWWQWRGVVHGRRREIGIGSTVSVPLKTARETARAWRGVAREGGDPAAERDRARRVAMRFEDAARSVHEDQIRPHNRNAKHVAQWITTLETYAFPIIGQRPVNAVGQADVLRVLAPIWTEKPETARRVRQRMRTVLDWARTAGHREGVNPVEGVEKGLPRQRDKADHFAALPWRDLPALMRRIEAMEGMGALALRFAILTAARSGEVRGALWREIDLDARTWTIPADRMKANVEHRVPLSDAACAVLAAVKPLAAGPDALVFPSRQQRKALSDMTLAAVLKRLDAPVTVHGFRSTFRDWAEEATAFPHEVKEAALAHTLTNKTEAAYRRTDLFEKRRAMMDAWAQLAAEEAATVVRIRA